MHEAVEQSLLFSRLLARASDGHKSAGQDFAVIGGAARRGDACLHIFIKLPGFLDCSTAAEYEFGCFGGELPAHIRGTGLHDDWPTLDWSRDVERTSHRQMFTLMIKYVHLVWIEEDAARLVG